jgi:hypothetical protein
MFSAVIPPLTSSLLCPKKPPSLEKPIASFTAVMRQPRVQEDSVCLHSLIAAEHDVCGYAVDVEGVLTKVKMLETLNPCARGFRALRIKPTI